ncbi:MAG: PD40 domain-containing protein, partial [Planctomycetes bacterium]|nr:PD40 domain-containing protein [Planctomycetota bacterium]
MPKRSLAPYGTWSSPITSGLIVSETIALGAPRLSGAHVYWLEMRPQEGGRSVVVRRTPGGETADVTPPDFNVRTRVHEYGGGAFAVDGDTVYFSNFADGRLYRQHAAGPPKPLTPDGDVRYADAVVDKARGRLILVAEDHTGDSRYPVNTISAVPAGGGAHQVLVSGDDFYSNPRISPDGSKLAWLSWNHPGMPWDSTTLWAAPIRSDGSLGEAVKVAGGDGESVFQPEWSPDGVLHFVSDRTGWWNLYRVRGPRVEALCEMEAEFGLPQWVFGMSTYAFMYPGEIICSYSRDGLGHLARLGTASGDFDEIETPYTDISYLGATAGKAVFVGASPTKSAAVVLLDPASTRMQVLRRSSCVEIDPGYLSTPEPIEFPTEDHLTAHALFYPPANRDFAAAPGELPPLVVGSHGGPTSAFGSGLDLRVQYWTSRGFAVVNVNYGGSTGYGRGYRKRLEDKWGVVD